MFLGSKVKFTNSILVTCALFGVTLSCVAQTTIPVPDGAPAPYVTVLAELDRNWLKADYHLYASLGRTLAPQLDVEHVPFLKRTASTRQVNNARLSIFTLTHMAAKPEAADALRELSASDGFVASTLVAALVFAPVEISISRAREYLATAKWPDQQVIFAAELLSLTGEDADFRLMQATRERWMGQKPFNDMTWAEYIDGKIMALQSRLSRLPQVREDWELQELSLWRARIDRRGMHNPYADYPLAAERLRQAGAHFSVEFLLSKLPSSAAEATVSVEGRLLDPALLSATILGEQRESTTAKRLIDLSSDERWRPVADRALAQICTDEAIRALALSRTREEVVGLIRNLADESGIRAVKQLIRKGDITPETRATLELAVREWRMQHEADDKK